MSPVAVRGPYRESRFTLLSVSRTLGGPLRQLAPVSPEASVVRCRHQEPRSSPDADVASVATSSAACPEADGECGAVLLPHGGIALSMGLELLGRDADGLPGLRATRLASMVALRAAASASLVPGTATETRAAFGFFRLLVARLEEAAA